jgi:hypothetical protein
MKLRALSFSMALGLAAAAGCQSSAADGQLVGTWTNDTDPRTVLTLAENLGSPLTPQPAFMGSVVGALLSPSSPGRLLIDVRRDALGRPVLLIPSFSAQGDEDILCQGCEVSGGRMSCTDAIATTTDALGGVVTLGITCQWTQTSAPVSCASVRFSGACPLASCPSWTGPRCGGGLCPAASVCTSASSCQCEPGVQLACCDGTACPPTGCESCEGGSMNLGCGPSPPIGCGDDVAGSMGVCVCDTGQEVTFPCGTLGTCEQLCSGAVHPARDAGVTGVDRFVFDASLPEGGFHFDVASRDSVQPDVTVDAAPCSAAKCDGCCLGGFCYSGTSSSACGQLGVQCVDCGAGSCVSGKCQ